MRSVGEVLASAMEAIRRKPDVRQGVVTAVSGSLATCDVGGASITVPCFTFYSPTAGDVIQILVVGSQWMALGKLGSGSGVNYVNNPSFESVDGSGIPTQWEFFWVVGDRPTVSSTTSSPMHGSRMVQITAAPGKEFYQDIACTAIAVAAGQQWSLSALVKASTTVTNGGKLLAWVGTSEAGCNPFQTGFVETVIDTDNLTTSQATLSGNYTIPSGKTHFRAVVLLDTDTANVVDVTAYADLVTARRTV